MPGPPRAFIAIARLADMNLFSARQPRSEIHAGCFRNAREGEEAEEEEHVEVVDQVELEADEREVDGMKNPNETPASALRSRTISPSLATATVIPATNAPYSGTSPRASAPADSASIHSSWKATGLRRASGLTRSPVSAL